MPTQPATTELARQCAELIEREESHLAAVMASLGEIGAGLRGNDAAALGAALERQDAVVQAGVHLRHARQSFRDTAARTLHMSADTVTLEVVSRSLSPAEGRRVMLARDRLRGLHRAAEDCMCRNALLTHYYLDFLQKFFAQITGGQPQCDRYGPQGRLRPAACGSMLHARG